MESAYFKVIHFSPPILTTKPRGSCSINRLPHLYQQSLRKDGIFRGGHVSKLACAKQESLLSEADKRRLLEKELHDDDEFVGMSKSNVKCKGLDGLIELLECLEREAIMGEDEGIEPTDYSRRALIFDKSSKVFQALKEEENRCDGC